MKITVRWVAKSTWKVSAIKNGTLIQKIYCEYSKKDAVADFKLWYLDTDPLPIVNKILNG